MNAAQQRNLALYIQESISSAEKQAESEPEIRKAGFKYGYLMTAMKEVSSVLQGKPSFLKYWTPKKKEA